MIAPLAVVLLAIAAPPRAAVVVRAAGFADADVVRLNDKINAETAATGVELRPLGDDVKLECVEEPTCARELMRAADAGWLLRVEVMRAGGQAQVSAALVAEDGHVVADGSAPSRVEAVLGEEPMLPRAIVNALRAAAPEPPTTTEPPPPPRLEKPKPRAEPAPPAQTDDKLSTMALVGISGIGAGALVATIGIAGALGQYAVIRDPSALGDDKVQAATLVPVLGVVGVAGVVAAGAGGWLLWSEM